MSFTIIQSDGCSGADGSAVLARLSDNALGGSGTNFWNDEIGSGVTIQSNRATSPVTAGTYINALNTTSTDGRVTANVYGVANGVGVVCRFNQATFEFYAYIGGATNSRLFYFDGATFNPIASGGPALTDGDTMAIVANGTTITAYLNGTLVLTAPPQVDIASGKPGTYLGGGSSAFDNFIYETGTAASPATHLVITSQPTSSFSMHGSSIVIAAKDAGGTTDVSYTTAVVIANPSGFTKTSGSVAQMTGGGTLSVAMVAGVGTLTPIVAASQNATGNFAVTSGALTGVSTADITFTIQESIAVTLT